MPELIRKKMNNTINCETKKAKFGFKKGMSKIKWVLLNTNFPFMETETSLVYIPLFIIFLVNDKGVTNPLGSTLTKFGLLLGFKSTVFPF